MDALKQPTDINNSHAGGCIGQISTNHARRCIPLWSVRSALSYCADIFRDGLQPPRLHVIRRLTCSGFIPGYVALDNSPFKRH